MSMDTMHLRYPLDLKALLIYYGTNMTLNDLRMSMCHKRLFVHSLWPWGCFGRVLKQDSGRLVLSHKAMPDFAEASKSIYTLRSEISAVITFGICQWN